METCTLFWMCSPGESQPLKELVLFSLKGICSLNVKRCCGALCEWQVCQQRRSGAQFRGQKPPPSPALPLVGDASCSVDNFGEDPGKLQDLEFGRLCSRGRLRLLYLIPQRAARISVSGVVEMERVKGLIFLAFLCFSCLNIFVHSLSKDY